MKRSLFCALCGVLGGGLTVMGQSIQLDFAPTGALKKLGFFETQTLKLSQQKPDSIKKMPAGVSIAEFGTLKLGPAEKPSVVSFALVGGDTDTSVLYVDGNADGDLSNDPVVDWTVLPYAVADNRKLSRHLGTADILLPLGDKPQTGRIHLYMYDRADPSRPEARHQVHYYRDYGFEGKIKLGEHTYNAFLSDENTTGDFRGTAAKTGSGVKLYIDLNGNNRFDHVTEAFDVRKPFSIGATTYDMTNVTTSGSMVIAPRKGTDAAGSPAQQPTDVKSDLQVGSASIAFKAKDLDGKEINFPADFKGKIVLLDFWATWCGPCRKEIPHLVEAYTKHHAKGFEVLGISLDKADGEQRLRDYIKENAMPWAQVFDGKYWSSDIAKLYDIHSIPAAFLVDGDTGKILSAKQSLRGSGVSTEVDKALKKKLSTK